MNDADPLSRAVVRHYLATHTREDVNREHMDAALEYAKGKVSAAARSLGMTRRSVYLAVTKKRLKELRGGR